MGYLIDSHCHLHDREFFDADEAEKALEAARANGVKKIICIGTSHEDSLAARDFATAHDNVYWTYGIHPENANDDRWRVTDDIQPVAIGEVGLDYHYDGYDRTGQIKLFNEMLQLAKDHDLPLSFHIREAFDDFFPIVANFPNAQGVVHCFTDSKKNLRRILDTTDFYVGVDGVATYSTIATPPLERILLETDAPFLAPLPHRGDKNQPAYVKHIAEWLAGKLNQPLDEIIATTTANAERLYNI